MDKILVYGKAQNRTVLGIANAYLKINPNSTLEDLRNAFPGELCQRTYNKFYKHLFYEYKKPMKYDMGKNQGEDLTDESIDFDFFYKENDAIVLSDGTKVAVQKMWVKDDFNSVVERAKQYDIKVADYKPAKPFEKGGFLLEYLNGYVPPVAGAVIAKKKFPWWILLLLLLLILGLLYFLFCRSSNDDGSMHKQNTEVSTVVDSSGLKNESLKNQAGEISKVLPSVEVEEQGNLLKVTVGETSVKFYKDKYDLTDESKNNLDKLYEVLESNKENKIQIVGYTDNTGTDEYNKELSENRAKAVAEYFVSKGYPADLIISRGEGASNAKGDNNTESGRAENRRVEFLIEDVK